MSGKRILQIANEAGPLRLFLLPVCHALREQGATVELACMAAGPNWPGLEQSGFVVHGLTPCDRTRPRGMLSLYKQTRRLLAKERYDLVVVHTPVMSWIVRMAHRDLGGKLVYMAHGLPFLLGRHGIRNATYRRLETFFGRWTDGLIVMNEQDAQAARTLRLTRPGGGWAKVPGVGVDVEAWSHSPSAEDQVEVERAYGLRSGAPLVLYLGRFIASKHPETVLELARQVGPDVDVLMAGEGPLWEATRQTAEAIGPHVKVREFLAGPLMPLMHRASLAVFPSTYLEGLPRFLLEAGAAGVPAVAYDVRGSQDVIENGRTGLLVAPGDSAGVCAASLSLVSDPDRRTAMGQGARQRIQSTYRLEQSVVSQLRFLEARVSGAAS